MNHARFEQAHQALCGGELNPSEAFVNSTNYFCKLWDERKARKAGEPYDSIFTEDSEEKTERDC